MSENQKVGIVSTKDGLIKVVISESKSPPLLGAKAVRVRLSQIYHLLPTRSHSPARRQASGAKNAPAEDVTVAESGASIKEFPEEEPAAALQAAGPWPVAGKRTSEIANHKSGIRTVNCSTFDPSTPRTPQPPHLSHPPP